MLVNKNEVIPFQKSPWNALCKNGILLKMPFFSKQNFKRMLQNLSHELKQLLFYQKLFSDPKLLLS